MVDIENVKNYKSLFYIIDGKIHELLVIGIIKNNGNIILKGINGNNQSFYPTELFYTKEEIQNLYAIRS